MNKSSTEYRRSLSEEEVHAGKLMVLKEAIKFFPKPFRKFTIKAGEKQFELAIEAVDCRCRGEAEPHQHFWLPLQEAKGAITWQRGASIVVRKGKDSGYMLSNQ